MNILDLFKPRKLRTLGDMDKMTVGEVDKLLQTSLPNIDQIVSKEDLLCSKCGNGLIKISPSIRLGELHLYECTVCTERCYKH